ncbi:MAG: SDR family oxidoreductase [Oligoflexia bacterium]|nr:SDR family oxidoreductase [Oligoflexia bacterium]
MSTNNHSNNSNSNSNGSSGDKINNVVITGASRGIGLALVSEYKARNAEQIIAICRNVPPELAKFYNQGVRIIDGIDVTDEAKVASLPGKIKHIMPNIDLLINNAGIYLEDSLEEIATAQLLAQFTTNAIAPLMITRTLLPLLQSNGGGKVAMISSQMGSIGGNENGTSYGYRASKAALNAFGKNLAIDLKRLGVAVFQLHPGYVDTDMTKHLGPITPKDSAVSLAKLISKLTLHESGTFWHINGEQLRW